MRSPLWLVLPVLAACSLDDRDGTQIGALKESSIPEPPGDLTTLDLGVAVAEAFRIAGTASMATAWSAHVRTMDHGTQTCPYAWLGAPPERFVEIDNGNDDLTGLSWFDNCTTPLGYTFAGFSYWENVVDPNLTEGDRSLTMDGVMRDADGNLLLDFDGEAADSLNGNNYASSMTARVLRGSLLGLDGSGLRGELDASWGPSGMELDGSVHVEGGFGPADTRQPYRPGVDPDPAEGIEGRDPISPELQNVTGWEPGMPRYTSVRFDLDFDGDCTLEPRGYVGVRGNEGFWFDVYFLPKYDPETDLAAASAFPYESIDNVECDGIGTMFVRNLDLRAIEAGNPDWSREISVDFADISASMPTPSIDGFVFTLQNLPQDAP